MCCTACGLPIASAARLRKGGHSGRRVALVVMGILGRASDVGRQDGARDLGRQRRVKRVTVLETKAGLWRWLGALGKRARAEKERPTLFPSLLAPDSLALLRTCRRCSASLQGSTTDFWSKTAEMHGLVHAPVHSKTRKALQLLLIMGDPLPPRLC